MEVTEEYSVLLLHVEDHRPVPDPGTHAHWPFPFPCQPHPIQKRHRMIEKQNDLKEVIVHLRTPTGAPPSGPRDLSGKAASAGEMWPTLTRDNNTVPLAADGEKACESCLSTTAARWISWGPAHEHCRLCGHCYVYWRKYGGLKLPSKWGQ